MLIKGVVVLFSLIAVFPSLVYGVRGRPLTMDPLGRECQRLLQPVDGFVYPEDFQGLFLPGTFDFSIHGRGTHRGHVSVFNWPREAVKSLLPEYLKLAPISWGESQVHPVIVVWGEINKSRAGFYGLPLLSGLTYREWQLYIPGVYSAHSGSRVLSTFVPRILVDHPLPQLLGDRFFYNKTLLDRMKFDILDGLEMEGWGSMKVRRTDQPHSTWDRMSTYNREWSAILDYLPGSKIIGDDGSPLSMRASAFDWRPQDDTTVRPSNVTMRLTRAIVDGMDSSLLNRDFESVASFEVRDWRFYVAYEYKWFH